MKTSYWLLASALFVTVTAYDSQAQAPEAPRSPGASITLLLDRTKISRCQEVEEEGAKVCSAAESAATSGEASLTLTPLTKTSEPDDSGERKPQAVTFKKESGKSSQTVELAPGRWELAWKDGSTIREHFYVVAKDTFEISLESIMGMCVEEAGACKLAPGKRQRSIEIPKVRELKD
jgi:hypothetical protein